MVEITRRSRLIRAGVDHFDEALQGEVVAETVAGGAEFDEAGEDRDELVDGANVGRADVAVSDAEGGTVEALGCEHDER